MEVETISDPRIEVVKSVVENKLGKVFDETTGEISQRRFDDIILVNRCGDVSKVTNEVIRGKIQTYTIRGNRPVITYQDNNKATEIASVFSIANHAYVIDKEGNVWDPITRTWGDLKEKEYLSRLKTKIE